MVGIFAVVGAVAFVVAFVVADTEGASLLLLLYVFLPVLNTAADMVSLWITRHFIGQVVAHRPAIWWILGQIVIYLVLAAICLVTLLAALVVGLTL